jgi:DNA-binding MarR family transcriptional regulator
VPNLGSAAIGPSRIPTILRVPILGTLPLEHSGLRLSVMIISRELLKRHFGDLWPVHNCAFINLIVECRRLFGGDLDQMLILTVIGDRSLVSNRTKGLHYEEFVEGRRRIGQQHRINTQSIADSTGIPRETVRRKLRLLVKRGWVERAAGGSWRVTEKAVSELAPATEATFDYFLTIGNALLTKVVQ